MKAIASGAIFLFAFGLYVNAANVKAGRVTNKFTTSASDTGKKKPGYKQRMGLGPKVATVVDTTKIPGLSNLTGDAAKKFSIQMDSVKKASGNGSKPPINGKTAPSDVKH